MGSPQRATQKSVMDCRQLNQAGPPQSPRPTHSLAKAGQQTVQGQQWSDSAGLKRKKRHSCTIPTCAQMTEETPFCFQAQIRELFVHKNLNRSMSPVLGSITESSLCMLTISDLGPL